VKNTIIDAVSAAPGWVAVYIQQMPSGEVRLVPMHVALWVRIERANDEHDEGESKSKQKRAAKMLQEYRPHVAGRDGRIVDYRELENEHVTYLIMATPEEEWSKVGNEAYARLMPVVDETSPAPVEAEAPQTSEPPPSGPN
jgi:hypothetical protein